MEVTRIRALRGPNLWSHHTAIQSVVSCDAEECPVSGIEGFETRLRARFPEIAPFQPTGHDTSISMAHVLELAALGLQAQAGCPVTFSCTTPTMEPRVYQVVVEYSEETVGRLALELAQALCLAARDDTPFDLADALTQLRDLDEDVRLGPSTGCIVDAAVARGIPYSRMTEGSMVRFGWGSKQRRIQAAEMDTTSAISEAIAQDKDLTKKLLAAAGVPVPMGREVRDAEDAWAAACEIGLPVVVKPNDGNQGKGVTVNITTQEHLLKAYAIATQFRDDILVERYMPGNDFRLLVVGNKLVAAARRDPPTVVGDGVHTITQLVDQVNLDPRRGSGHSTSLTKIRIDDIARSCLATQGVTADDIP
ncbi:MAG: cyanophycin synthetase, partial [Rhodoferax sp.]